MPASHRAVLAEVADEVYCGPDGAGSGLRHWAQRVPGVEAGGRVGSGDRGGYVGESAGGGAAVSAVDGAGGGGGRVGGSGGEQLRLQLVAGQGARVCGGVPGAEGGRRVLLFGHLLRSPTVGGGAAGQGAVRGVLGRRVVFGGLSKVDSGGRVFGCAAGAFCARGGGGCEVAGAGRGGAVFFVHVPLLQGRWRQIQREGQYRRGVASKAPSYQSKTRSACHATREVTPLRPSSVQTLYSGLGEIRGCHVVV
eukprot:ctg_2055.g518